MPEYSKQYDNIIKMRAQYGPEIAYRGLDELTAMAFENHFMDPSTGTQRERASILLSGAEDDPGQHGYDASRSGRPIECKPNLHFVKNPTRKKKISADGHGSINDHNFARHKKFIRDDLIMQQSQFFDGICAWIVEFPYTDETFFNHIVKQLTQAKNRSKSGRVCGRFSYHQWWVSPQLSIPYINKDVIQEHRLHISGGYHGNRLYKWFMDQ